MLSTIPVFMNQDDVVQARLAHATAAGDRHPPLRATHRIEHHVLGWQRTVARVLLDPELILGTRLHRLERRESLWQVFAVFRIGERPVLRRRIGPQLPVAHRIDLFSTLTRSIWSEVWTPTALANADAVRRDLQRAYIDQMTTLVVNPPARTPADARAVARRTLRDLDRRLGAAAASPTLNAYMAAHVEESRARIQKALTADLGAER